MLKIFPLRQFFLLALSITLLTSCGGTKNVVNEGDLELLSAKKIIKRHYKNELQFKTLTARIKARYEDKKQAQTLTVNLRMEKDETIWLSASFLIPLAKVKITKDRVQFYEKLNKTYFDGDFSFLSKAIGADLDYYKVQNLLLGQSIFDLKEERYNASINKKNYVLVPEKELALFNRIFKLDAANFKMAEQRLTQPKENRAVRVSYPSYQEIDGRTLPKEIKVESLDGKELTTIEIDYRSIKFDEKVRFPFSVPKGYEEILIK